MFINIYSILMYIVYIYIYIYLALTPGQADNGRIKLNEASIEDKKHIGASFTFLDYLDWKNGVESWIHPTAKHRARPSPSESKGNWPFRIPPERSESHLGYKYPNSSNSVCLSALVPRCCTQIFQGLWRMYHCSRNLYLSQALRLSGATWNGYNGKLMDMFPHLGPKVIRSASTKPKPTRVKKRQQHHQHHHYY